MKIGKTIRARKKILIYFIYIAKKCMVMSDVCEKDSMKSLQILSLPK